MRTNKERREISEMLLDLLYPPRCPICDRIIHPVTELSLQRGKHSTAVRESICLADRKKRLHGTSAWPEAVHRCCPDCERSLPWIEGPACMKCGKPVGAGEREYCDDCRTQRHFFDQGVAAFTYTGAMRHCVYRMKMSNRRDYVPFCAESMVQALRSTLLRWRPEVIIPVPMHPRKKRLRGYNQSELLALEIGRLTGLPVETEVLRCIRLVQDQKKLGRQERMRNLRGSFAVFGPFPNLSRVLLVDDVYTTGSTLDEISRVLRSHGVKNVFFVVLCTGKGKKTVCTDKKV